MAVSVEAKNVLFCFEYEYILSNFISSNETHLRNTLKNPGFWALIFQVTK